MFNIGNSQLLRVFDIVSRLDSSLNIDFIIIASVFLFHSIAGLSMPNFHSLLFIICNITSLLLSYLVSHLYLQQHKNTIVACYGISNVLIHFTLLFSCILPRTGCSSNIAFAIGLFLNHLFLTTHCLQFLHMLESLLALSQILHPSYLQRIAERKHRRFFIAVALAFPVYPTVILLATVDKALVQPVGMYLYFARMTWRGTLCWVIGMTAGTLLVTALAVARIVYIQYKTFAVLQKKSCGNPQEFAENGLFLSSDSSSNKANDESKKTVFKSFLRHVIQRELNQKTSFQLRNILTIVSLYLAISSLWVFLGIRQSDSVGRVAFSAIGSVPIRERMNKWQSIKNELLKCGKWRVSLPSEGGGGAANINAVQNAVRFVQRWNKECPVSHVEIGASVNGTMLMARISSENQGIIMKRVEQLLCTMNRSFSAVGGVRNLSKSMSSYLKELQLPLDTAVDEIRDERRARIMQRFLMNSPVDAVWLTFCNRLIENGSEIALDVDSIEMLLAFLLVGEMQRFKLLLFLPSCFGAVFFLMYGTRRKYIKEYRKILFRIKRDIFQKFSLQFHVD